jgi:hypothetical protein
MRYCKTCSEKGIKKSCSFNYEGLNPLYCSEHKTTEMINVINKRCEIDGCMIRPSFNYI